VCYSIFDYRGKIQLNFSEEKLKEAGVERRYLNLELSSCLNEILSELYKADKSAESD